MALKIGDIVYLQASEIGPSTWLCAEGHLSDEVFVTQNETLFSNCLWEIYTQCQYSADMEWREAQETIEAIEAGEEGYEVDKKSLPALLDKLVQVRRAAESEMLLNKMVMQLKLGKLVTFGDVVQLRHLKSKRVMTVSSWQLAKQEKENMRIQADDVGDSLSFLSIIPKSKSDREGGAIKSGSECFIRIHEKSGEYLRAVKKFGQLATEGAKEGKLERMEVNCSPELTAWTLHIFHSHVDPREKIIFSQSLITLGDPEAGTCITVNNAEPGPTGEIDSARVVTTQLAGRNPEYAMSYIGTDMLWLVEKEDVTEGGVVYLKTTRVVLVHYNSGLYLKMEFDGTISAVRDRHSASLVEFHSADGDDSGAVFLDGSHISLCISGTRFAVCTNDTNFPNADGTLSTLCETTNDIKTALRLSASLHVSRRIDSDLHFGVAAVSKMRSFVAFTETKMAAGTQPAPDIFASATAQVRLILTIVDGLCIFLGERREEEEEVKEKRSALMKLLDDPIRGRVDSVQQPLRQCILREQGLIDVMLDILVLCAKGRFDQVKLNLTANVGESGKNPSPANNTKPTLMRKSSSVRGMMISPDKDREDESTHVTKKRGGGPGSLIRTGTAGETSSGIASLLGERKGSSSDVSGGGGGSSAKGLGRSDSRRSFDGQGSISSKPGAGGPSGGSSKSPSINMGQKPQGSFGGMMKAIGTSFRYAAASTSTKKFKVGADDSDDSDESDSDADSDNGRGENSDDDDGPSMALTKLGNSAAKDRVIRKQSTAALLAFQGGSGRGSQASVDDADARRATVSEELAQALLRVVYMTAKGNHFNQLHVSQRLSVILSLVTSQVLAVKCMRELLRDNLKILQSTVHQADIDTMVENIRQHELNTTFLRLLQSTCSCPKGVDSTQRMVVLALYGEHVTEMGDSIVMTMYVDDSRPTPMEWTRSSGSSYHYIPIASDANFLQISGRIMGGGLIKHGMPRVLVRWTQGTGPGKDARITMSRLFSSDDAVAIDVLSEFAARSLSAADILPFGETRKTSSFKRASSVMHSRGLSGNKGQKRSITNITRAAPKMASTVELKCRVADYLIAQLYLVADLCLDRNYVSIHILEKIYSYDLLISILKRDDLSNAIKAPTCRILRTLWVDREPQVAKIFPSLIRSHSTVSSHRSTEDGMRAAVKAKPTTGKVAAAASSADEANDVGSFSVHTFVILQQIISDYLWLQLNSGKRDEYSYEILELLQSLMKFGFYSSDSDKLQDVVVPIIRAMGAIRQIKAAPEAGGEGEGEEGKGGADDDDGGGGAMQEIDGASWWVRGLRRARVNVVAAIDYFSYASMKEGWMARAEHRQAVYESSIKNRRNAKRKPLGELGAEQFWEQRVINFLESIFGMVASLTIVLIVCAVSVSNVAADPDNTPYSLQIFYDDFDVFVSVFFSVELVVRIYCHLVIYPNPFFFFQNSFNVLDFSLVAMDLILVGLGTGQNSLVGTARLSRIARVLRLLRLLRIFRALRLLKKIADASRLAVMWIMPERFTSLSELDVKTLTSMLGIMSFVYKHIQDQQLDVVVEAFDEWSDLTSVGEPADAVEIYKRYVAKYDKARHEIPPEFDNIVLDILMYSDTVITREALQLLMTHKNSKQILFEVLEDLHLVYSRPVESKLAVLRQTIHDLQRLTEMYEIWQDMDSEEHEETAQDMLAAAQTLQRLMVRSNEDKSLESTTELLPDPECQKLVRNLRVLDTAMSAFETLFDGGREDLHPKVTKILRALSAFLVSFLRDNERNQFEAFTHLAWFIETIDHKFDSHLVVRAILVGNYRLINECTRSYISFFAQKILTAGRKSEYLQLFLGLCEKSYLDKTFVAPPSVISEITRVLIGKEWKHHILLWICAPGSTAYDKRSAALDEYKYQEQLPLDGELSPDLQYHVTILKILAACRIGPKLQAIYPLDHIIHAMLDRNCLSQVRIPLGELLLQLFESGIDNVEMAEYVWRFMDFVVLYLQDAMGDLTAITQMPQNEYSCFMRTRMRDWVLVMLSCLVVFFSDLDMSTFGELSDGEIGMLVTTRTDLDIQKVIKSLYVNIRQFMDFHAPLLGNEIIESCGMALLALCTHSNSLDYDYSEVLAAKTVFKRSQPRVMRGADGARLHGEDATQQQVKNNFNDFVDMIRDYERQSMQDQSMALFVKIPLLNDKRHSDVRFEVLLKKFCGYVQSLLRDGELNGQKSNASNQAVWVVQLMRRLLEKEYEAVEVQDADHVGSVGVSSPQNFVETARSIELRTAFMNEGLVQLCVDCCASATNLELVIEAMLLLTVILSRTSAKAEVQRHLHDYLCNNETSFFFKCIDGMLKEISYWCKSTYEAQSADATPLSEIVVVLPDNAIVLRLLLLLCDGDYHPLKDMIRTQEKNAEQVNIIARLAAMADVFSRHESPTLTNVCLLVFKALRNIIYGLNAGNQEYLVLQTEVLSSMNRLMRSSRARTAAMSSQWYDDVERLKECVLDVLTCAVEGHSPNSSVFDRIINSIELNVLSAVLMPALASPTDSITDMELTPIESKYLELLETLGKSSETLTDLGAHKAKENISFVEVVRGTEVHKVYFQKPSVVELLSEDFISKPVERLDCSSQEVKLNDFMREIKSQYIETQYQLLLKPFGLNYAWAWRERIEWLMFINAVVINCLLLEYFDRHAGFTVAVSDVDSVLQAQLSVQIALAALLTFLFFFIRLPAKFVSGLENGMTQWTALISTISDITFIWRFVYLVLTVLAISFSYIFATALLLDWVALDATTRQVLKAVQYPIRQLVATFIIIVIVLNIFAGAYFMLFIDECEYELDSLFDAWKLALSYGLRGEYGMGHEFTHTLGDRLILDVAFYFIVLAILRNSFMAIIVDTFGKLREVQFERDSQANNSCFICGVDRHDYDARYALGKASSFQHHRETIHNVQGYVYFVLSIWTQPQEEDNGIEMFVRKRIAANDVQWFPIGIAHNEDAERFAREAAARGGMLTAAKSGSASSSSSSSTSKAAALVLLQQRDDASERDEGGGDSDMETDGAASDASQTRRSRNIDRRDASPSTPPVTSSPKLSRALKSHRKAFVRTDHARDEASTDGTGLKNYIAAAIAELSTRLDNVTAINKAALSDARASGGAAPVHSPSWSADGASHQSGAAANTRTASFSPVHSATTSTEVADYSSGPNSAPSTAELGANLGGPSTSARGGEEASAAPTVRIIQPSVLRATAVRPWGASPYSILTTSAETISGPSAPGLLHQPGNVVEEKNLHEPHEDSSV